MTLDPPDLPRDVDMETLAINALKAEGVFLHRARVSADALRNRIESSHPNVQVFKLSRDEFDTLTKQFAEAVSIATDYHLGVADAA